MNHRLFTQAALLIAATLILGNAKADSSPQSVMQNFLAWRARPMSGSFSSTENAARLSGLMSRELLCLLQATDRYRDHHVKASPEDKPPYADGDMFLSSAWEPPVSSDIEVVRVYGADADVWVRFVDDYGTGWRDRFRLRNEGGDWKVADVDRLGRFEDTDGKFRVSRPDSLVESFYREMDRNRPLVRWRRQEVSACKTGG